MNLIGVKWKPHKVKDIDTGRKFSEKKLCPRHGVIYGSFCLRCRMKGLSGQDWVEVSVGIPNVGKKELIQ
jgi:hypothetical protein